MQEHALVRVGDVQGVACLGRRAADDVAQGDDRALGLGQRFNRFADESCLVTAVSSACSGQATGAMAQWPGQLGWSGGKKRSAATAGSSSVSDEKGRIRDSRTPRARATLTTMPRIHVGNDDRPSNRSRLRSTTIQAS